MELSVKLSKQDFLSFRRGVLRANRLRLIFSILVQACLWLWMIIPFFQLFLMGIEAQVSFFRVLQTYPVFMLDRGYLSPSFFGMFVVFLCCTPTVLSWTTFKKAYAAASRFGRNTVVLSQWRICMYDENKQMISAVPYDMVKQVLWLRHSIAVVLKSGDSFAISTRELPEEVQEQVLDILSSRAATELEMVSSPAPLDLLHAPFWQDTVQLRRADLISAAKLLSKQYRPAGSKLLAVLVIILVLNLWLVGFSPLTALLALLTCWVAATLLPFAVAKNTTRAAKRHPWMLTVLSGEIAITEQGLFRQNQLYYSHFAWHALDGAAADDSGVVIFTGKRAAAFLPADHFADRQEMERFADWLNLKIQKKKADNT